MVFTTDHQAAEVAQPGKQAFHFPSPAESSQAAAVLGFGVGSAPPAMGRDHFGAEAFHQLAVQAIAIVSFVSHQSLRNLRDQTGLQRGRYEGVFSRASTFCPNGDRKTIGTRIRVRSLGAGVIPLDSPFCTFMADSQSRKLG